MKRLLFAAAALLLVSGACRPVLAIGWEELLGIVLVVALLLGPVMWRLARSWARFQEYQKKEARRKR